MEKAPQLLLVEDEAIIALSEKRTLVQEGYRVDHVFTGEEAIARVADAERPPVDLILMDIDLGAGISGTEAARKILEIRHLPVVFLTSHAERAVVDQVRSITRYGYVVKTAGNFVLFGAIETAMELFAAQQSSLRELARNRAILSAVPDLIFVMNLEGTFLEFHVPSGRRLALPRERVIGSTLAAMFSPEEVERHLTTYRAAVVTGEVQVLKYELPDEGVVRTYESRVSPLDEQRVLAIVRDITVDEQRERAVQESHQYLEQFMDRIPETAIQGYRPDGTVVYWNRSSEKLYGYTRQQALGRNMLDLIIPDALRATVVSAVERMVKTGDGGAPEELTLRNARGEEVRVESIHTVIRLPEREPLLFCMDVPMHDRTVLERTLSRRLQFQELIARVSAGFMRSTPEETDAQIQRALEQIGQFFGVGRCYLYEFSPDRTRMSQTYQWCAPGVPSIQHLEQDIEVDRYPEILNVILAGNHLQVDDIEALPESFLVARDVFIAKNVRAFLAVPLVSSRGPIGYMGIHNLHDPRSWTEEEIHQAQVLAETVARGIFRKTIQQELSFQRRLMQVLLDQSPDLIYFKDTEGRFIRVSRSLAALHGDPDPAGTVGRTDFDRFSSEEAALRRSQEEQIMREGRPLVGLEEQETRDDGTVRWLSTNKAPFYDNNGNLAGIVGTSRDITETKTAYAKVEEYSRAQELLLREVHHRVKNTIATIRSLISLQADRVVDPDSRSLMDDLQERVLGMLTVYDHLDSASDFRQVPVAAYLEDLINGIRCTFSSSAQVQIVSNLEQCNMDSRVVFPLGLIVNELLTNARKYAFSDGREGRIEVVWQRERNEGWMLKVADNGVGLSGSPRTGFGLGLVESLAAQIGGSFSVGNGDSGVQAVLTVPE